MMMKRALKLITGTVHANFSMLTAAVFILLPSLSNAAISAHGTSLSNAVLLPVNDKQKIYKFNYSGDDGWFAFYAYKGLPYDIQIPDNSVSAGINPVIVLYNSKGVKQISHDFGFAGEGELLSWNNVPEDGFYYLRIVNQEATFSSDAQYALKVYLPLAPNNLTAKGRVIDQCTKRGIPEAIIDTPANAPILSYQTGEFALAFPPGTYTLTARLNGYNEQSQSISLESSDIETYVIQTVNFELSPIAACEPDDPVVDLNQLKQQSVAVFDDQNGELLVKDVRLGDTSPFSAKLQNQGNFIFKLADEIQLNPDSLINPPAFFDFDTSLVDIPSVFAFGKRFHVQLRMIDNVNFLFEIAGTPTELY